MSTGGGGDQVKERIVELCTTPLTDWGDADGAEKENQSDSTNGDFHKPTIYTGI